MRALTDATRPPAGPVHVNCCFEEPTVPDGEATWSRRDAPAVPEVEHDPDAIGAALDSFVASYAGRRGVITIGALRPPQTLSLLSLGALLGWPVLAEPLSGLRLDASDAGRALAAGQLLLGDDTWLARHRPEVVLQVGATPTTRASQRLVAAAGALVVLDRDHLDPDPNGLAERRIAVDPEALAAQAWDRRDELTGRRRTDGRPSGVPQTSARTRSWIDSWMAGPSPSKDGSLGTWARSSRTAARCGWVPRCRFAISTPTSPRGGRRGSGTRATSSG